MLIRRQIPADNAAIAEVTAAAFRRPDQPWQIPPETDLIDALRRGESWLPALSLVAVEPDGTAIGHVLATRGHVDSTPVLGLAPLSVLPDRQRRGVGTALMHAVLGAADALGEPLVALLGDPHYYRRFGFRPSSDYHSAPAHRPPPGAARHLHLSRAVRSPMTGSLPPSQ